MIRVPLPKVLPPNISLEQFYCFISRAISLCGIENIQIIDEKDSLEDGTYHKHAKGHDLHAIYSKDHFVASSIITPRDVPEVQSLMRLFNEFGIPVWPFSIGRNLGYGSSAPRVPGSVCLDLGHHMNRILDVDADSCYALVEPGVTYFDFHDYLEKHDLRKKVWMDVPDVGGGSILGNSLERGAGYSPYGDHWMMHCGLEVVLPNGDLVRTGMGAMPDSSDPELKAMRPDLQRPNKAWQLFNYGYGPYNDGIFTQSSLGVVVKMGFWLMPNPGGYQAYMISFANDEAFAKALEITRPLRIAMIIQNVPTFRHVTFDAAYYGPKSSYTDKQEPLDESDLEHLQEKLDLGRWNFYGAIYGPDPIRQVFWDTIRAAFAQIPGTRFYFPEDRNEPRSLLRVREKTMQGIPSDDELSWIDWLPNGAHLFFSPITKISGTDAMEQHEITQRRCREAGLDYMGNFVVGLREMHYIVCIVFDRADADSRDRAHRLIRVLIEDFAAKGWGEYRTHIGLQDQIAATYNFNDNAQMKLNETIKNALDPNGILAPGKYGVWPQKYDKTEWVINKDGEVASQKKKNANGVAQADVNGVSPD